MSDVRTIELNIAARHNAEEAVEQIAGYLINTNEDRFWECLATLAAAKVGKKLVDDGPCRPMSDEEAKAFERTTIRRGVHKGKKVGRVSPDYWAEMAEDVWHKKVRRYVQSDHFKRRVGIMGPLLEDLRAK